MHLVTERNSGTRYAVKVIIRRKTAIDKKLIQTEFLVLQQMQHRHVVKFLHTILHK